MHAISVCINVLFFAFVVACIGTFMLFLIYMYGYLKNEEKMSAKRKKAHKKRICKLLIIFFVGLCITGVLQFMKPKIIKTVSDEDVGSKAESTEVDPEIIMRQNDTKTEDQKADDIFFKSLYMEKYEDGVTSDKYKDYLDSDFAGKEILTDISISSLPEDVRVYVEKNVAQLEEIDRMKVPEGYTLEQVSKGEVQPLKLDVQTCKEECSLYNDNYKNCRQAGFLQQAGRSAYDVVTAMMKNMEQYRANWSQIVEYVAKGTECYIALLFFSESEESKLDICFWIAKFLYEMAHELRKMLTGDQINHCYLLAMAFVKKGMEYGELDKTVSNEHENDLSKLKIYIEEQLCFRGLQ